MKTIIITGSTKGIGLCLFNYLKCKNKYNLVIHGSSDYKVELETNILFVKLDLINNDYRVLIDKSKEKFETIDILINNAAICDENNAIDMMYLNTTVPLKLTRYAIEHGVSKVINVSSGAALFYSKFINYSLSKNMLEGITRHQSVEFYPKKVVINALRIDTPVKTGMTKNINEEKDYEQLKEPDTLLTSFMFMISSNLSHSGKIYSSKRLIKNLFLEQKMNNEFICFDPFYFDERKQDKTVLNGDNHFNNETGMYPIAENIKMLEKLIGDTIKCSEDNITLVNGGISGAFHLLAKQFITNPGDEMICHHLSFNEIFRSVIELGGVIKKINCLWESSFKKTDYNFKTILDSITPVTKIIYLTQPTYIFTDLLELTGFIKKIPSNIAIILDECYIDYIDKHMDNSLLFINDYFVFGMRSFSKLYGMAAHRMGYIISNDKYKKCLSAAIPYKNIPLTTVNAIYNTIIDPKYFTNLKRLFLIEKLFIKKELNKLNIKYWGDSIFILIKVDHEYVRKKLEEIGIIIPGKIIGNTVLYPISNRKINSKLISIIKTMG